MTPDVVALLAFAAVGPVLATLAAGLRYRHAAARLTEAHRLAILDEPEEPPDPDSRTCGAVTAADAEADTIAVLRAIERGDLAGAVGVVDRTRTPRQLAAHLTGVTAAAIDALSCLGVRVDTTRWAAHAALRDLEELP